MSTEAADDLSFLATLASILEATAPKPGNVSPGRPFRDMRYEDFVASALAAGPALALAGERPLGETILASVRATRRRVVVNTNLGIILLFAPLARGARRLDASAARRREGAGRGRAAEAEPGREAPRGRSADSLRQELVAVLSETTVDDARATYRAIREAAPGGMGTSAEQDLAGEPTVTLLEAMRLAAERDAIAAEYASDFALTFDCGAPALRAARGAQLGWEEAVVETFLALLARKPDTLIARKLGRSEAELVSKRAGDVVAAGGIRTENGRQALAEFDGELRDPHNSRNPGTTADLAAAALFVVLLEGGWTTDRSRISRAQ
jgi:triphosphoribosyl-dephospho-CoA synthase